MGLELLAVNGAGHTTMAETMRQMATLQGSLADMANQVAINVGIDLAATSLDEVGVGEVVQAFDTADMVWNVKKGIDYGEKLKEVLVDAQVAKDAWELKNLVGTGYKTVELEQEFVKVAKIATFSWQTVKYAAAIGAAVLVLGGLLVHHAMETWTPPAVPEDAKKNRPLTPEEKSASERLHQKFPAVSEAYIEQLLRSGLTEQTIEHLLAQWSGTPRVDLDVFRQLVRQYPEYVEEIAALLEAGYDAATVRAYLDALQRNPQVRAAVRQMIEEGLSPSVIRSHLDGLLGPRTGTFLFGFPRPTAQIDALKYVWLSTGWDDRSINSGMGLQHILYHALDGNLACWGIQTDGQSVDMVALQQFVEDVLQHLNQGSITYNTRTGNYNVTFTQYQYGSGNGPLLIAIGTDGSVITVFRPTSRRP